MVRSTATKHFGQHTETARAGWMTADAWTAIQHRQHVIKQHIPLIASARSSHPFMLKMLRIWRSMVPVFRADREVVKACKEARVEHKEALANDLDMALEYGDSTHAWELGRLLPNKTARSVKPRPIPPTRETERHEMDAHTKKVFGADRTTNAGNIQDHAPPYQCGSMAEIAAMIPPLQKRARRLARYRAVPSWATPNEIHAMCLDGAEAVEDWRSGTPLPARLAWYSWRAVCKKKEGLLNCFRTARCSQHPKKVARAQTFSGSLICWASARLWRVAGAHRGPTPSLAVRLCAQPRGHRLLGHSLGHLGAWCLSEQQWDIVKAFRNAALLVTDVLQDLHRQARMHIKKDAYLTRTGVRQGDNLGPSLFRRSYAAAIQEWNEQLDARPWARRLVVRKNPNGQTETSIDLSVSGYADDLA